MADARRSIVGPVIGAAVVGFLLGVLGTFKHQVGITTATGQGVPVGLVLSLAMLAALLVALRLSYPTRWVAGAGGAGAVAAVGVLSLPSPGGSGVILLNWAGIAWTLLPAVVAAVVIGWPRVRRTVPAEQAADGASIRIDAPSSPGGKPE